MSSMGAHYVCPSSQGIRRSQLKRNTWLDFGCGCLRKEQFLLPKMNFRIKGTSILLRCLRTSRLCDLLLEVLDLRLEFRNIRLDVLKEHVELAGLLRVEVEELIKAAEGRAHDRVVGVKRYLKEVYCEDGSDANVHWS